MQQKLVTDPPDNHPKPGSLQINNACNFTPVLIIAGAIFSNLAPNSSK